MMSWPPNSKTHSIQMQCLNLSEAATQMLLLDSKRQSGNQKPNSNSLSRALSETSLDINSLQQIKEKIFSARECVSSESNKQRRTRNLLIQDRNEISDIHVRAENIVYFPHNRQHHYLNDVELSTEIFHDVDLRFGCPTKTSLLRSRQRAASTCVLSKQLKAQILKIQLKTPVFQKALSSERVRPASGVADNSYHGFLTGGRYNWAHLIDGKSRTDLGLYIPRSNPQRSFFVAKINKKEKKTIERVTLGCCTNKMQDTECQCCWPRQSLQPQPLSIQDASDNVPDLNMEEPGQAPPPTPVSVHPVAKSKKLTGVMTATAVHLKEKESNKQGLKEGGQNIWINTIS